MRHQPKKETRLKTMRYDRTARCCCFGADFAFFGAGRPEAAGLELMVSREHVAGVVRTKGGGKVSCCAGISLAALAAMGSRTTALKANVGSEATTDRRGRRPSAFLPFRRRSPPASFDSLPLVLPQSSSSTEQPLPLTEPASTLSTSRSFVLASEPIPRSGRDRRRPTRNASLFREYERVRGLIVLHSASATKGDRKEHHSE